MPKEQDHVSDPERLAAAEEYMAAAQEHFAAITQFLREYGDQGNLLKSKITFGKKITLINWLTSFAFLILSVFLTGCGGTSSDAQPLTFPIATQTRTIQSGDQWIYKYSDASGPYRQETFRLVNPATTNYTQDIDPPPNSLTLEKAYVTNTIPSQTLTVYAGMYTQDSAGNIHLERDEDGKTLVGSPEVIPGTWAAGALHESAIQPDVTYTINSMQIGGDEVVETNLGRVHAWKATISRYFYDGSMVTGYPKTIWYAPQIAAPVRIQTNAGTATLVSSTHPL